MNKHDFRCNYSSEHKLALTGASGFIGSHLKRLSSSSFTPMNIEDVPHDATWIHAAADLNLNSNALVGNIERDLILIELINHKHRALIYLSSNNVYPKTLQCRTNETLHSENHYDSAKIIGEFLIQSMLNKPFCLVRIADVFGDGQKHGNFFKSLQQSLTQRRPITLYGQGGKIRSYIYAPECARFLLFLAQQIQTEKKLPAILNCCHNESLTLKQIAEYVSKQTGLAIDTLPVTTDVSHLDIRTMNPSSVPGYTFSWPSLWHALDDYISICSRQRDTKPCAS